MCCVSWIALNLIFSFTNGAEWDGPYRLQFQVPKPWRNRPIEFFNEVCVKPYSHQLNKFLRQTISQEDHHICLSECLLLLLQGLAEELNQEGACDRAIFPDTSTVVTSCAMIGNLTVEGVSSCSYIILQNVGYASFNIPLHIIF